MTNLTERLIGISINQMNYPLSDLPFDEAPDPARYWMPPELVSLHGTDVWDTLDEKQRIELSQREFCLICSIFCNGEKEAISDVSKLMLKRRFEDVQPYLSHLIREENNHIDMFVEFCRRYGKLTRFRYIYAKRDQCSDPIYNDLLVFVHLLVFEELGDKLNRIMSEDASLPPLVRAISKLHTREEARHIAFGRSLLARLTAEVISNSSEEEKHKLHDYVYQYVQSRHYEYHGVPLYAAIGIPDAYKLRNRLIHERDVSFFFRADDDPEKGGLRNVLGFLHSINLISEHHLARIGIET